MSMIPTNYPEADPLPFSAVGSFDVYNSGRPFPPRDFHILNYTTLETWKSLRLPKTRECQDLSMFPGMHLDILLQVLSHLHPLDLLHLSHTTHDFHDFLQSPPGELIWRKAFGGDPGLPAPPESTAVVRANPTSENIRKKAFEGDPGLPAPPKSISARVWTILIYGPNICDHRKLARAFPRYPLEHEIYTLIPRTRRTSGDTVLGTSSTSKFHPDEGKAILKMYEDQQAQNDPVALSEFVQSQRPVVADIELAASNCAFWVRHRVLDVVETRNKDCRPKILKSVKSRLLKEGWESVDILAAAQKYERIRHLRTITTLTHRLWKRIRPYIVWYVARERASRLDREDGERFHLRIRRRDEPIPGHENLFYPPPHELTELPPLVDLVEDSSWDELSSDDPRVMAFLTSSEAREFIDGWVVRTQAHLVSLLPTSENHDQSGDHLERLERATSVFRFPGMSDMSYGGFGIGWELARGNMHIFRDEPWLYRKPVQFSELGSATVHMLLDLLGLPDSMSAATMDGTGARFVCGGCRMARYGRRALPWRECIQHDLEEHQTPSWFLVSPLATADLLRREEEETPARWCTRTTWQCAVPRELRGSSSTKFKWDLKLARVAWGPPIPERARLLEAGKRPAIYRCTHCAVEEPNIVKLFNERSIWVDVADKHGWHLNRRPDGRDWIKVELLMPRLA
ncbi:hypothetical protein FB45DRAFT_1018723 [Roridomyces roridus]|uniref:F-box domain-containing protein n=1 Tax=Roridomyces roridus TaxID=1738132 RepID=A0AAD7G3E9_9AGAR|nr:hypothetical protein FB45DRAFT_1018723 [Roridomyces roridus]